MVVVRYKNVFIALLGVPYAHAQCAKALVTCPRTVFPSFSIRAAWEQDCLNIAAVGSWSGQSRDSVFLL